MVEYEYDEAKRQWALKERGLDFAAAGLIYENPEKETLSFPRGKEDRRMDMVLVELYGAIIAMVYVARDEIIRVISMRRASRRERRLYAKLKGQS